MTNDELRMTNEIRIPKLELRIALLLRSVGFLIKLLSLSDFCIRTFFGFRYSGFGFLSSFVHSSLVIILASSYARHVTSVFFEGSHDRLVAG